MRTCWLPDTVLPIRRIIIAPIVAGIDVYNVEAEAYGSVLGDAGGIAIPAVERNACAEVGEIAGSSCTGPRSHRGAGPSFWVQRAG